MKRPFCLLLALLSLFLLCSCKTSGGEDTVKYAATQQDIDHLEKLYAGRSVYFGEAHDHANTGGNSDGDQDLNTWITGMENLHMDFAAIVDHRQTCHMSLALWQKGCFIGGTEAATTILDSSAEKKNLHYNMLFTDQEAFTRVLQSEASYNYDPQTTFFSYPHFTTAQFKALIQKIKDEGGMFVHVHPKSNGYMTSDNPAAYWFADETGLEVFVDGADTKKNYKLWTDLLYLGARVWATAGSDSHNMPNTNALTAIYAEEKTPESLFRHMRIGDFAPGYVGIRMTIGDAKMGSSCSFSGKRVVFSTGSFHESILKDHSAFQVVLFEGSKEVFRENIDHTKTNYFAYDCSETAPFYRVEVQDQEGNPIALGNPIWLD